MSIAVITVLVVTVIMIVLGLISIIAAKKSVPTPTDFYLAGRTLGTPVLLLTMGATYFSAWTILGAVGLYYRTGTSFLVFPAWTIMHAVLVWLFGSRIWLLGKKHNFITPGDMIEDYYGSPFLRILFCVVGIVALVPYMLIQVTGGAFTFEATTQGQISYGWGVIITSVIVCIFVIVAGYRGTAWTDTAMGIYFGTVLIALAIYFIGKAGGLDSLKSVGSINKDILISNCNWKSLLGTATGLMLGFVVLPHMWQKYYSAKSIKVLARVCVLTPFWNSWLMATLPFIIGLLAYMPGLVPGLTAKNSDTIIPMFFAYHAPIFGTFVAAAILTFAISTINSQLLTSSSLVVKDIYTRFINQKASEATTTFIGKIIVIVLTVIVVALAFTPGGAGYLIPVANLGFAIGTQLFPAALGPLYWPRGTREGAIASILLGEVAVLFSQLIKSFIHPTVDGLIVSLATFFIVSMLTKPLPYSKLKEYHDYLNHNLFGTSTLNPAKEI
jgi:solute:Na+ symporter, SSS family